jgi:hypothetical protein
VIRSVRPVAVFVFATLASTVAPRARADEPPVAAPSPADATLAEKLFVEGRVLMDRGDNAGACARFEASRKLEPRAIGTLLNLALCNKNLAHYATAAPLFREVAERSRGTRQDRAEVAEQHLHEVEPKISFLKVVVPPENREPGMRVTVDGNELPEDKWDADAPTDGGNHVIEATAPGKKPFNVTYALDFERAHGVVTVPHLSEQPDTTGMGIGIGVAGLAVFGVGLGLGISNMVQCGGLFQDTCKALDNEKDGDKRKDKESSLLTQAWISNIGMGVGVVGIAVGTYFIVTSPARKSSTPPANAARLRIVPVVGPTVGGLSVQQTF